MRPRHLFWVATLLAIGTSGCRTVQPKQGLAGACADWRWIGISQPDTRCPEVPGWTVRPLFPQLAPVVSQTEDICARQESDKKTYCEKRESEKIPNPELIRELNRFCVYERANRTTNRQQLQFLADTSKLVRVDRDCASHSLVERYSKTEKSWSPDSAFHSAFLAQAGKPKAPLRIENQRGVRLAFLDTQPTGGDVPEHQGSSPHGYTLALIARDLVCAGPESDARCAAQITTRLALPIIRFDPAYPWHNLTDYTRGGYLGMQSDLAEAIRSEVDSWRSEKQQEHLILNLSLAWDGNLFGGLSVEQIAEMRAGTQAVYRALQYAARFDALILAAAGNKQREPCANVGPLLPAAWESQPPRDESCQKTPSPLLYAVGGVKSDGWPLGNSRISGMPRRAAYGETALFSGSSVATAIASAIAAVVWDSFPELTSHEVMKILDETGASLPITANFYVGAPSPLTSEGPPVRRLLLCAALEKACAEYGPPCPLEPRECDPLPPPEGATIRAAEPGYCEPWSYPQPPDEPCPACIPTPPPTTHP